MPTDEKVEKVALAIAREAVDDLDMFRGVNGDAAFEALMALSRKQALAALEAAEAGAVPVYRYQTPDHRSFSQTTPPMPWQGEYTPVTIRAGTVASPTSEASREERAAIRKEAFEEAAKIAKIEAEQCASLGCSNPENSQNRDRLFARARSAEAIATAIRARGET